MLIRLIDGWKKRPQRKAARRLLRQEVDLNLRLLKGWWDKLKPHKNEDEIHWVDKVVYAREFADADLPEFPREAYLREQPLLSSYTRGDQFTQVVRFYENLGKIEKIHEELRRALEKDIMLRQTVKGGQSSAGELSPRYEEFLRIAAQSWFKAANLIDQALTRGNPLEGRSYPTLPSLIKMSWRHF